MTIKRLGGLWNVRITLFQWLMVCSLAAVGLLSYRLDRQIAQFQARRDGLFAMNHDLYVEEPARLALVNKPIDSFNELCWQLYIPPKAQGQLVVDNLTRRMIPAGEHFIRLQVDRTTMMTEQLFVDEEPMAVSFKLDSFFSPSLKAPATCAVGGQLDLLEKKDGRSRLWIESSLSP